MHACTKCLSNCKLTWTDMSGSPASAKRFAYEEVNFSRSTIVGDPYLQNPPVVQEKKKFDTTLHTSPKQPFRVPFLTHQPTTWGSIRVCFTNNLEKHLLNKSTYKDVSQLDKNSDICNSIIRITKPWTAKQVGRHRSINVNHHILNH